MILEATLKTAIARLGSTDLENEAEVKLAIIEPVLRALNWDAAADPRSIKPEYSAGHGRVDYALLCHGRPQVFIEAKRRHGLDVRAEGQLFRYAANNGIPLLVLTDGYHWDFYLSMADGLPEERRFHHLELSHEDGISESIDFLKAHLQKDRVESGEARRNAEAWLDGKRERERACKAIPAAWSALLNEPDELLLELLIEKVLHTSGARPEPDDVEHFLANLPTAPLGSQLHGLSAEPPTMPAPKKARRSKRSRVEVTKELLHRIEGCTVEELVAAFEAEFGNGNPSTARQALSKVPKQLGFKIKRVREEGRGSVYRAVSGIATATTYTKTPMAEPATSAVAGEPRILEGRRVSEGRKEASAKAPTRPIENELHSGEGLQRIVYDLMHVVLEACPDLLDEKTLHYLQVESNPLGLKLSYPLIRDISRGRVLNGHPRYKRDVYAERWYVCTEWNKPHHRYNSIQLSKWVDSLIAHTCDPRATGRLLDIGRRFDAFVEDLDR